MAKQTLTVSEKSQLIDNYKSELRKLEFQLEAAKAAIKSLEGDTTELSVPTPTVLPETAASTVALQDAPKKRGPKPKEKTEITETAALQDAPKKRGPKPKEKTETTETVALQDAPKKRGPKPKEKTETTETVALQDTPKKRGPKTKEVVAKKAVSEKTSTPKLTAKQKEKLKKKEAPAKTVKAPKENTDKKKPGPQSGMSDWDMFVLNKLREIGKSMSNADLLDFMKEERDAKNIQEGDTRLSHLLNRTLHKLVHKTKDVTTEPYAGRGHLYRAK